MEQFITGCIEEKSCFFCRRAGSGGFRYLTTSDFAEVALRGCALVTDCMVEAREGEILKVVRESEAFKRDQGELNLAGDIPIAMVQRLSQELIASVHAAMSRIKEDITQRPLLSRLEQLLMPRSKGVRGGWPTCWKEYECGLLRVKTSAISLETTTSSSTDFVSNSTDSKASDGECVAQGIKSISVIRDEPFDIGYINYNPDLYNELLDHKMSFVTGILQETLSKTNSYFDISNITAMRSPPKNFREKCRFSVSHSYKYDEVVGDIIDEIDFMIWDDNGRPIYKVEEYPIASRIICDVLPILKRLINSRDDEISEVLRRELNAIHCMSTLSGNLVVRLLYNERIFESGEVELWKKSAASAVESIKSCVGSEREVHLTLRAKNCKASVHSDSITERFYITNTSDTYIEELSPSLSPTLPSKPIPSFGFKVYYVQSSEGFSNPNAAVNSKCLVWICEVMGSIYSASSVSSEPFDLLEMYCGNGNHTMAIAKSGFVRYVVGVEINNSLVVAARENAKLNGVESKVEILQSDSSAFTSRLLRQKAFTSRTKTVKSNVDGSGDALTLLSSDCESRPLTYSFSAVLVDPPRCGLDNDTLLLARNYQHIIYISCNPLSLMRDLTTLLTTHSIQRLAFMDQFAYSSEHIETAVYLRRK